MLRRRHVLWASGAILVIAVVAMLGVIFLTMSDSGRAFVSRIALGRLAERINGQVTVGGVRGSLLLTCRGEALS